MKRITKKQAKGIAREIIQQQLARACYILYDNPQYDDIERKMIEEYLDKDCERMLKLINL